MGKMLAGIGAVIVVVCGILWFVVDVLADATHIVIRWFINTVWQGWLFPNGWNLFGATPFFWLIVAAVVVAVVWCFFVSKESTAIATITSVVAGIGVVALLAVSLFMYNDWNARFYNQASVYQVQDTAELPNSLVRISEVGEKQQVGIEAGEMPSEWVKRSASSTGAAYVMRKTGDSNNNTELLSDTITYIYASDSDGGEWTAIRNGTRRQPIFGVSSWAGTGESVKTCEFKGDSELKYAFHSTWGKNLNDKIAQFKRDFIYDDGDVYGYCDDGEPVIVIPGTQVVGNYIQVASTAYGVLLIRGSASGEPVFNYRSSVQPGELPGPVYPLKLVEHQRDSLTWSAGRVWPGQPGVGYEAVGVSDLLLKSKVDGRLYWVTPLKPNKTDSQTIVAYSMTPADTVISGQLNQQRVYVLNDGDLRSVNFNDLANAVTQAVAKSDPGFFTGDEENQGRIVEFVPTSSDSWQVFAERGGRAVYKIEVSGGQRMHTSVIAINEEVGTEGELAPETPQGETGGASCDSPAGLTDTQIANCIQLLANELAARATAQ